MFSNPKIKTIVDDMFADTEDDTATASLVRNHSQRPVHVKGRAAKKLILLSTDITEAAQLPQPAQDFMQKHAATLVPYEIDLGYDELSAATVLRQLLPAHVTVPTAFETIGHIAHVNLREEHLPYKHLIGEVFLDKNLHVHTVINKVGRIANEYRVYNHELIAGEERYETTVREHSFDFRLNASKVYWNSRLSTEHQRMVGRLNADDVGRWCDCSCDVHSFVFSFACFLRMCERSCDFHSLCFLHTAHANLTINMHVRALQCTTRWRVSDRSQCRREAPPAVASLQSRLRDLVFVVCCFF
jgi:hypothetical protein